MTNEDGPHADEEKLWRTRVVVELLHRGPIEFDDLGDLHRLTDYGDASGDFDVRAPQELSPAEMSKALTAQGSEPSFLLSEEELAALPLDEDDQTFRIRVPAWHAILWNENGHGHEYEGHRDWFRDLVLQQHNLDEDDWEPGVADFELVDLENEFFLIDIRLERAT